MNQAGLPLLAVLLLPAIQDIPIEPPPFDYSKVERTIAGEPKYVAEPRYAMILLGPLGKKRLWMALDKSSPEAQRYDVLYLDRDGDGHLGEEGERIVETKDKRGQLAFRAGRVKVYGSSIALDHVQLNVRQTKDSVSVEIYFRVNNRVSMLGGFGSGGRELQFGTSPGNAPILHVDPDGPFSFLLPESVDLEIGKRNEVAIYVGRRGSGPASFMAFDERFLDLKKDRILITLTARDRNGKEVKALTYIDDHC